jgi:hypothetical protein
LCSGACMLLALIMYLRHYYNLQQVTIQNPGESRESIRHACM